MHTPDAFRHCRRSDRFAGIDRSLEVPDPNEAFRAFHREDARRSEGPLARLLGPIVNRIGRRTVQITLVILHTLVFIWLLGLGPLEFAVASLGMAAAIWSI